MLTLFFAMFHFDPPEHSKSKVFWRFQGGQKRTLKRKGLRVAEICFWQLYQTLDYFSRCGSVRNQRNKYLQLRELTILNSFLTNFPFYTYWKDQKIFRFLNFSGVGKRGHFAWNGFKLTRETLDQKAEFHRFKKSSTTVAEERHWQNTFFFRIFSGISRCLMKYF